MKKKIIITGGHLTPALAVIDELQKKDEWEIYFLGRKHATEREKTPSIESQVIQERGIWFFPMVTGRFPRHLNRYALYSFLKIPIGFLQAFYYLLRFRPQVILSFGGYVSVPVVLIGYLLKIPSLTHEQTTVSGLASKINSRFATKIAVSWIDTQKHFSASKVVLTGNPVRKEIFKVKESYWQDLKYPANQPLILITGGNQGSHLINLAVEKALPKLLEMANVFHQCGHLEKMGDFERLEKAREKLPADLKKKYHVKKYLTGVEMGTFFNKSSLIISRAGANTLTEVAALGKPALFIPLPWLYKDEQNQNAKTLSEMGMAEILPQAELSEKTLVQKVSLMLRDLERYEKNAQAARKTIKLNAAERIVKEIKSLV